MTPEHPVVVHISQRQAAKLKAHTPPDRIRTEGTFGAFMVLDLPSVLFVPWPELGFQGNREAFTK